MDIRISEHEKRIIRLGVNLFRRKIGKKASKENVNAYLRTTKNKALIDLLDYIDYVSENTKSEYQHILLKEYSEFGIWLAVNHPILRKGIVGILKMYTKYDDFEIDLEPCLGKVDTFLLEHLMSYLIKKFSSRRTYGFIMSESLTTPNKVAQYFMAHIDEALIHVKREDMYRMLKTFSWFGVWVGINDTAYRHQFYYMLNKCGNQELQEISTEFYREPSDWFINLYQEGVNQTRELWNKNEIPRHETSTLEAPCVVKNQQNIIKKYIETEGVVD